MQRKLIAVLIANLFVGGAVYAQGFTLNGEVGAGGIAVNDRTQDASKLNEYRDLEPGVLSIIDLKGRAPRYYVNFYGENLGRDDMFLKLDGGSYNLFKYALYSDSLTHNFGFNLRSPYGGLGSANVTAPLTYVPPACRRRRGTSSASPTRPRRGCGTPTTWRMTAATTARRWSCPSAARFTCGPT